MAPSRVDSEQDGPKSLSDEVPATTRWPNPDRWMLVAWICCDELVRMGPAIDANFNESRKTGEWDN